MAVIRSGSLGPLLPSVKSFGGSQGSPVKPGPVPSAVPLQVSPRPVAPSARPVNAAQDLVKAIRATSSPMQQGQMLHQLDRMTGSRAASQKLLSAPTAPPSPTAPASRTAPAPPTQAQAQAMQQWARATIPAIARPIATQPTLPKAQARPASPAPQALAAHSSAAKPAAPTATGNILAWFSGNGSASEPEYPAVTVVNGKRPKPQSGQCGSHPILGAIGKVWNSPNSALGLAAAGASYLAGKWQGTNPSFQIRNNSIQLLNSPLNVNNRAYTLGNVQVYGVGDGPSRGQISYTSAFVNTGRHEEGHTVQGQILGPLYLPAWGLGRLFGGDSAGNPIEAGADKYALGKSCSGF